MTYAVRVVDGVAEQIIVGRAEWAIANLGGYWIQSSVNVGIGWIYDPENGTFVPPQPSEQL